MTDCCCLSTLGFAAAAYLAYKLFNTLYNIFFPFFISSPIDLKKKAGADWAVVTGATDGIGKAYAFALARRGFNLLLVSRTQQKLEDTKKEILAKYSNVEIKVFSFDFTVGSSADYEPLFAELNKIKIGVLVNNVGMSYEYPEVLHKVDGGIKTIGNITTINTLPPTLLCASVLPNMVERNSGVVINISSGASYQLMSLWAVYSATKKYLAWFTAILRREYADTGIIFQTVCPMLVATKMSKVKKQSFFTPGADTFAESALRSVGIVQDTTGFFSHQIQAEIFNWIPAFIKEHLAEKFSKGTRAAALRKKAKSQ
ncbi:unnamed protein product [Auanema sp. JU1783]|nr:unnamed protein product [Auanema sp. JU1783]